MLRRPRLKRRKVFGCEWLEARRLLTGHDTLSAAISAPLVTGTPSVFSGNIDDPAVPDLYQVQLAVGQHLASKADVQSLGSNLQSFLRVFNSAGIEQANSGGGFGDSAANYTALSTGTYYVGVSDAANTTYDPNTSGGGFGFTTGQYTLTLLVTPPVSDANDSIAHAAPINFIRSVPTSASGAIAFPRDADLFKFALNKEDTADLSIAAQSIGSPLDNRLRLFDAAGTELAANHTPGSDAALSFHATAAGIYYVGVSGGDNATYDPHLPQSGTDASVGSFRLDVTVNSPAPVTSEIEPNGTFDAANSIAVGTSVAGAITPGDQDFYLFTITSAGQLTLSAAGDAASTLAPRVTLCGPDRLPLLSADGLPGGPAASIVQHLPAGTYFVAISSAATGGAAASGAYHINTSFIAATPPFTDVSAGADAVAISRGDLNGDGIQDLVVVNHFSNNVSVLLGIGDGTFRTAVNYSAGFFPTGVTVGDFNHDGHDDVAVSNQLSGDVSVLMNNGDGTLAAAVSYAVGGQPTALTVGQFNGDAFLDLAVTTADAGGGAGNVVILTGVGDGTFTVGNSFTVGVDPVAIVAAQFSDAFTDLAVANRNADQNGTTLGGGTVSVLRGNGDGTFQAAMNYAVGDQPTSLAVGDANNDGKLDLAIANAATQDISLLLGQANGSFAAEKRIDLRQEPPASISGDFRSSVLLADFNGDGRLDLALANSLDPRVRVALGKGNGTFNESQIVAVGGQPQALVAGDFTGNGRLGFASPGGISGTLSIRIGLGDGTFQAPLHFPVRKEPNGITAADFNHDGAVDLAVANNGSPGGTSVLLGLGDGTYQGQKLYASGISTAIAWTDFNGDGRPDLVTTNFNPDTHSSDLTVLLGLGDGTFQAPVHYAVGDFPIGLVIADFNGDGNADVAVVNNGSNNVSILIGDGNGTLQPAVNYAVDGSPQALALANLNGDAYWDLVVANTGSNDISILMGKAGGTFQPSTTLAAGTRPVGLAIGDFGNGRPDIAVVNDSLPNSADQTGAVSILMNQGNGSFAAVGQIQVGAMPLGIAAGDFNGDGHTDLAVANSGGNSLSMLAGLGGGAFTAPVSINVGPGPTAVMATDLNGDGRLDLASAVGLDDSVVTLLGRGDGTFVKPEQFSSAAIDSTATLADVTGDGTPDSIVLNLAGQILVRPGRANEPGGYDAARIVNVDRPARAFTIVEAAGRQLIAAVDRTTDSVSLYQIAGNGTVTSAVQLPTGLQPARIAGADLNGDGREDLVVANAGSGTVSVFYATAAGSFSPASTFAATDHPAEISLVDLNGDGLLDIVLTDEAAGTVVVLINRGSSFAAPLSYRATTGQTGFDTSADGSPSLLTRDGTSSFATGDFAEDGIIDLVVVNRGDESLALLEGDGRGGFLAPKRLLAGVHPAVVRAGHFFPDGHLDLAVLDADNHTISILRGDGHGGFSLSGQYDAGNFPNGLSIGDFDGNGVSDLIVGNNFGDVMALPANGDGTFQPFTRVGQKIGIAVGDVTGDGRQSWLVTDQTHDKLVLQVGGKTPGFSQGRSNGVTSPGTAKLADVNGDGIADMLVANSGGNDVLVYLGLGGGQFAPSRSFFAGTNPVDVQVADVNGDHRPDFVVTNEGSNDVSILLGDSATLFRPGPRLNVGIAPVSTQVVSPTPGAAPVLLVTNSGSNNVYMLENKGSGFFNDVTPTIFNTGLSPQSAILGNFFGDGLDLVTLNYLSNSLSVFRNLDPTSRHDIGSGGVGPIAAVSADFAANGSIELVIGNNGDGALAIFSATADGLIESDAIFSETLQHPVALALAAAGEGQELRLLAANEGDENVRVFSRESVLQPAKLADNDFSTMGLPGFSFNLGGFSVFVGFLGGLAEAGISELFVGLEAGQIAGGGSGNISALRDAVEQVKAVVTGGTKWIESAVGTIISSTGLRGLPDGAAVDVIESVLDVAAPQIPWQALHQFFNSVIHGSVFNQKAPPKPAVVEHMTDLESTAPRPGTDSRPDAAQPIDDDIAAALFGGDSDDWLTDCDDLAAILDDSPMTDDVAIRLDHVEQPGSSAVESKNMARDTVFAQWLLPGAIAAVLVGSTSRFGGRESTDGGPRLRRRGAFQQARRRS